VAQSEEDEEVIDQLPSNRTYTDTAVQWTDIDQWGFSPNAATIKRSASITSLINEVISLQGWQEGNAITLTLSQAAQPRTFRTFESSSQSAPLLVVRYESDESPAEDGLETTTIAIAGLGGALVALAVVGGVVAMRRRSAAPVQKGQSYAVNVADESGRMQRISM